jgi:molybdate transport system ATP-binding protein
VARSKSAIVELRNASVALDGKPVLSGLTWRLAAGENWLVEGDNGAGKTTFLRLVAGKLWPVPDGRGRRIYHLNGETSESPVGLEADLTWLSPEEQERYQRRDWELTGVEVVVSGIAGTDLLYERPRNADLARAGRCLEDLGLGNLRNRSYDRLSQGELRRILIARAVVAEPGLLILDEINAGLDREARRRVSSLLELLCRRGTQVVMTAHRDEDKIPAITHRLTLAAGRIARSGCVRGVASRGRRSARPAPGGGRRKIARKEQETGPSLVSIDRADVYLDVADGFPRVLKGITWCIRTGENWAVTGPNGSGKSTLLRFIFGDLTCAVGGRIERYSGDRAVSVLVARGNMSCLSADLQVRFPVDQPVWRAVASGFYNQFWTDVRLSAKRRMAVKGILEETGLAKLEYRCLQTLSFGEVRRVLLARALVAKPALLLLDEPLDGLDRGSRKEAIAILGRAGRSGAVLVMVSHHPEDFPSSMTHALCLAGGRVVSAGPIS